MRLKTRISRLESQCPNLGPCEGCGLRDPETGLAILTWVILLANGDGTHGCFCKVCGREFSARLQERGDLLLAEDLGPAQVIA